MKKLKISIISAILVFAMTMTAFAAFNPKVQFTDPTTNVGEEFTVTMKVKAPGASLGSGKIMLNYDPAYLEFAGGDNAQGGAGKISINGDSSLGKEEWAFNLKFKALAPGSTSVTVDKDTLEIYDDSQNLAEVVPGQSSITINGDGSASINANLASLKTSPGALTPEFAPEVTEYSTVVGGECNKLTVSAQTADSNAKVIISGNSDLQIGENIVTCQITAQDGTTTKTYTIKVTKQEGEVDYGDAAGGILQATVNGNDYEVATTFDETMLPEGFLSQTVNYKGQSVLAGVNPETGLTLMYLIGSDGSGDFFIYDAATDQWSPYATINTTEKSITVVPMGSDVTVPEGFAETTLELNGKKVHGWIWSGDLNQEYCMVYGMNENGEKGFYRYDMKEKTIQRFFSNPVATDTVSEDEYVDAATKYNELIKDYNLRGYIMIGLGIAVAILLVALIIVLITSRGNGGDDDGSTKKKSRDGKKTDGDEERIAAARERRAKEREAMKARQQRAAQQPVDEAEERYMRGIENPEDDYTRGIPQQEIRRAQRQEPVNEAQLQQELAKAVMKTTEPEHKPAKEAFEDDGFETFDI